VVVPLPDAGARELWSRRGTGPLVHRRSGSGDDGDGDRGDGGAGDGDGDRARGDGGDGDDGAIPRHESVRACQAASRSTSSSSSSSSLLPRR